MSYINKGVISSAKIVHPCTRDDNYVYLRTNIVKIKDTKKNLLGLEIPVSYWQYDEEVLTHSEYAMRLEEKLAQTEAQNLDAMTGIADMYEMLIEKGVI